MGKRQKGNPHLKQADSPQVDAKRSFMKGQGLPPAKNTGW